MPLDVIRKRLQVSTEPKDSIILICKKVQGPTRKHYAVDVIPKYRNSVLSVAVHIVRHEGVLGLYKGLLPSVLKAAPSSAITFFVYSFCQRWFLGDRINR